MPFTIGKLAKTGELVFEAGGEVGHVTYRLWAATDVGRAMLPPLVWLFGDEHGPGAVVAWDVVFSDGAPFDPSPKGIADAKRRGEMPPLQVWATLCELILAHAASDAPGANVAPRDRSAKT